MTSRRKNMVGLVFGRLTVVEEAGISKGRKTIWACRCECGEVTRVVGDSLRGGKTRSCGCLQSERSSASNSKHGMSESSEYAIWKGIIQRCTNPSTKAYPNYGGRGITICDRWLYGEANLSAFECFLSDIGRRPSEKHSVDRINNDGNYDPGNCRWASRKSQARNQRTNRIVEFNGHQVSLAEACERAGVPYKTVWHRLKSGWAIEAALEQGVILTNPEDMKSRSAA